MKNLTPKQNKIIKALQEQFAEINRTRHVSTSNPLVRYANEFNGIRQQEYEDRANIIAKNNAIISSLKERASEEHNYLYQLVKEVDDDIEIKYEVHHSTVFIYLRKGGDFGRCIYLSYHCNILPIVRFEYEKDITPYSRFCLMYCGRDYHDIHEVIQSDYFAKEFKELLNYKK
jgi:hypothetical protein